MKKRLLLFTLLIFSLGLVAQQSKQVKDLEKKRLAILEEIKFTKKLLEENARTTTNVNTRINLLNEQIKSRTEIVNLLDQEVAQIEKEISVKEQEIEKAEKALQEKRAKYTETILSMYVKRNQSDKLLFILSADDFSQALRRFVYLKEYSSFHKTQAEEIERDQNTLLAEKAGLERNKESKLRLLDQKKEEQTQLELENTNLQGEVKTLQSEQKKIQKDLSKKQKEEQDLSRKIQKIIAEEIARAEREEAERKAREAKAAASTGNTAKPAGTTTYSQTKEDSALTKNFGENKGKIPFPLKGSYKIVNRFGKNATNTSPLFEYKGIDLLTVQGTDAICVFDGEVILDGVIEGYCRYVLIKHGRYYTFYQNLDKVYVKKGDKLKKGQAIGRIYNDITQGEGTVLHFEIHDNKQPLNPELWLKK